MDGRRNTAAISSGGESAVQACKDLGNGWYLPAYEELVKMVGTLSFNNGPSNSYWSSTEYYGNDGRYNSKATNFQTATVLVTTNGALSYNLKAYNHYVRCVWRN
jgi:hypothetical protein